MQGQIHETNALVAGNCTKTELKAIVSYYNEILNLSFLEASWEFLDELAKELYHIFSLFLNTKPICCFVIYDLFAELEDFNERFMRR